MLCMLKYCLLAFFFCSFTNLLIAQENSADSLRRLPDDTVKANRLHGLASTYRYTDPVKAESIVRSAIAVSQKIDYSFGLAAGYTLQSSLLVNQMKLDSGKLIADKAFALLKDKKDLQSRDQFGILTNTYGVIFQYRQLYDSATSKYIEAARIFTETGNDKRIFFSYHNLSVIYTFLNDSVKMILYSNLAQDVAAKTNDTNLIITGLQLGANAFDKTKKFDSVLILANKGLVLARDQHDLFATGKFHQYIGIAYMKDGKKPDSALFHLNEAIGFLTKANSQYDIAVNLHYIGRVHQTMKNYPQAVSYFKKAIDLQKQLGLDQLLLYSLNSLAEAEQEAGNSGEAVRYLKEYIAVNDSVLARNNRKQTEELEAKYQLQKKETLLLAQQVALQKKNTLNYVLAASALALLLISGLSYYTYKQKRKLQQQRISELETEKQLTATESVLKGEEQERARLAKDLHDGLGGMLSGIKYSFNTIKKNQVMTPDNVQMFERSIDMLDSSIKEMRRVAHNMMPEALVKFGLDTALKDFCEDINQSGALQVSYQSIGMENAVIEHSTAITIYRIVQELINNTLKHASAKTGIVQATKSDGRISITVEDDGKGFDASVIKVAKGIGWLNIRNRVEFLKGTLDVQSEKEKGTSVHIEFSVS